MPPANQQQQKKKQQIKEEPRAVTEKTQDQAAREKPGTRKESVYFGIPGTEPLTRIERTVPADEPPALPPNDQLKYIGNRVPRQDGRFKTTGAAKYPSDTHLPNMLYGKFLSSTVPHARVSSVDTSSAERHPGVKAVHVIENDLLSAQVLDKTKEVQSKYPVIRYSGQPIAAVAATSPQAAQEAVSLIKVQYEELPFVLGADEARRPDAPKVFPAPAAQAETAGGGGGSEKVPQSGNVRGPERKDAGDVAKGFAASDAMVEGEFRTQVQTHSALEPHGVVADWKPDMLTVSASTQSTMSVRDELATIFKLPKSKVRVLTEYMGGGFGAKFGAGNVGVVAVHLSKKAGAPVKLFSDRKEEHWTGGNRPDSQQHVKIGATRDGKLQAIQFTSYGTAGVGTGAGTAGPAHAMYKCDNLKTEEYDVFTNASPGTAFRAPGHPPGCFALEQAMDQLAEKLGMDPLVIRDLNDESPARREERRIGAEKFGWKQKFRRPNSDPGPIKRGVGVAQSVWYRIVNMDSGVEVRINRDGSVEALSAVQDIGGGIKTVIAQVVAEELGIQPRDVQVTIGDTVSPPGPPSGGSMTTTSITPAVRNAAYKAKQQLLAHVKAPLRGADPVSLSLKQLAARLPIEMVSATAQRSPEYGKREGMFLGGVQFVEVRVDTETGIVKVEHVVAVHDCGRPMNMLQLESQVNGGVLQGISYALYENRRLDRNTGIMVNPNLEQYKILGAKETPTIEVHIIEHYLARSSTDAGGIGEPATIPTAAAIANAFYNATGVRVRELPITPARVLAALGNLRQGATA
ncbi:MAG: xanthine dehydrogenase family protein molybdopterin-binding subunit [Acidobacteria bacterium]|nr:MAG: xanthine dehydrogenase family protein molybdopterin-binding subunit [Acidobacteriota bacterium]